MDPDPTLLQVSGIPKRPLIVLRTTRPLQFKFEDAGIAYVPMV